VLAFIDAAEALPDAELSHLREYAALALTALFAGRQDSSVHLRSGDIGIENLELWLRLHSNVTCLVTRLVTSLTIVLG
jgi:hypothetical protein